MGKSTPGYGDFGNLGKHYDQARQGVPKEIINYFWTLVDNTHPAILDVGCGTGIVTRQLLRKGAKFFGSDRDPEMIKIAKEKSASDITYVVASADKMPFDDTQFDAVTAFSAFHWFSDKKSASEIKRVLKRGGIFFVVNKDDVGDFKDGYRTILKPFISGELPEIKKKYDPFGILRENKFGSIQKKSFAASELFTLEQAIAYLQSVSLWNLVLDSKKEKALRAVEEYCKNKLANNLIMRRLEIVVISGMKV